MKSSGYKKKPVIASKGIKSLAAEDDKHGHGGKEPAHGRADPHAWQAVANVKTYVANIRDALIAVDFGGKADYESAAGDYLKGLDALEAEIKGAFADVAKPKRRVITSHDAFRYYGNAYGIAFLAPQGVTGDLSRQRRTSWR